MSKTLQQIYTTNPITSNLSTDLMYFVQSPYTPGTDAGMTFANFSAQFGSPYTPSSLSEVNDTNVTLTLGGTPLTALLQPVSLTLGWSGTLSPARGGTGVNNGSNTLTLGGNTAFSGGFTFTGTLTGNTSVTFPTSGTLATTASIPSFPLSLANGGTGTNLANGTTFQAMLSDGAGGVEWSTYTLPLTLTTSGIFYSPFGTSIAQIPPANSGVLVTSNGGVPSILAAGTTGQVLQASSAGTPAWSTPTYPTTSGTSRKVIISDGTNNVYSTETYATPGTSGNVMTSDGTNWISAAPAISTVLTTKGDILGFSTVDARIPVGSTNGQVLQVNSASSVGVSYSTPTYPSASGTLGKFLISDGTNNVYSTSTIPTSAGATANKVLLSDGTNYVLSTPTFPNASASVGKFIRSDGTNWIASTPTLPTSAGTSGKILQSDGTNYVESTPTYPSTSGTSRKIIVSDGTNNVYSTETYAVPGTSGNVMTSDGTNWTSAAPTGVTLLTTKGDLFGFSTVNARVPVASGNGKVLQVDSTAGVGLSYSTPTYPSASGSAGQILRSDGTNNLYTTSTYPNTNAVNTLLYASSANVMSALATANSGVLVTDGSGVPSISTTLPSGLAATNLTLTTPALGTPSSGTLTNATGYTIANLSDVAWTDISGSISLTGYSGSPTITLARQKLIGKTCFFHLSITGTSNATSLTVTGMPNASQGAVTGPITLATNNSATTTNGLYWKMAASGTTITIGQAGSDTGWTNTGTKAVNFIGFYETT